MSGANGASRSGGAGSEVRLSDLYQEVILDHNRNPRNFRKIEPSDLHAHGVNALCGDDYHLYLKKDATGRILEVAFWGQGCAISKSSASMMTQALEKKTVAEASALKDAFLRVLTSPETAPADREAVGRLKIFEGVKQYPVRVKCATLIWRTLEAALCAAVGESTEISTETGPLST